MKYKVGDKVIIQRGNYFNSEGKMDKWIDKTMTIKSINYNCYKMIEDADEFCGTGWDWYEDMIKCLAPESQTIHIYIKGNETHALLKQNKLTVKESIARCNPADEFSLYEGAKLALDRLFDKEKVEVKKDDNKVEFKVGDRVKCIKKVSGNIDVINEFGFIVDRDSNSFLVNFDEHINGHFYQGITKRGHGWWLGSKDMELINENEFELNGRTASWVLEDGKYYLQGK